MTTLVGHSGFRYQVDMSWGKLPDGWDLKDAAAVAVDSKDRVYVFNRGEHPVAVFDRAISMGSTGPVFPEGRSALFDVKDRPKIVNYVYGLGGRDVRPEELKDVFRNLISGNVNELNFMGVRI